MKNQVLILLLLISSMHISFSQINGNISKYSLDILTGFTTHAKTTGNLPFHNKYRPQFRFRPGAIILHRNISSKFSVGLETDYNNYSLSRDDKSSTKNWNSFSATIGPEYKLINKGIFSMQVYGRLGASFISTPQSDLMYLNTEVITNSFTKSNTTALESKIGTNFSIKLSNRLHFIANAEYASNLNNTIKYKSRDISSAVKSDFVDVELANSIPFNNQNLGISTMSFNFGLSFTIGSSNATDYGSTRSNKKNGQSTQRTGNPNGNGNQDHHIINPVKANDWNSTRSNKTSKTTRTGNPNQGKDTIPQHKDNGDHEGKARIRYVIKVRQANPNQGKDTIIQKGVYNDKVKDFFTKKRVENNPSTGNLSENGEVLKDRKRPERTKYSNITLTKSQKQDNDSNEDSTTTRRGRRGSKKDCLETGGTFSEKPNGTYFCYKSLSYNARLGNNTGNVSSESKKRKCWKAGGTWMTNSQGSYCLNSTKNKVKEVIKKKNLSNKY